MLNPSLKGRHPSSPSKSYLPPAETPAAAPRHRQESPRQAQFLRVAGRAPPEGVGLSRASRVAVGADAAAARRPHSRRHPPLLPQPFTAARGLHPGTAERPPRGETRTPLTCLAATSAGQGPGWLPVSAQRPFCARANPQSRRPRSMLGAVVHGETEPCIPGHPLGMPHAPGP